MTPTEFWFKLVDMTQSNAPTFTVLGRSITEKQLIWIIGLSALVVILILVRWAIMWVMGGGAPKPVVDKNATTPAVTPEVKATTAGAAPVQGTPQELLSDTSDRKRSLHDYVTPDTIHADVMKQTLNNDFPYQTMKPDPTKISASPTETATPVVAMPLTPTPIITAAQPQTVTTTVLTPPPVTPITAQPTTSSMFGTPAPILPPLPSTNTTTQVNPTSPMANTTPIAPQMPAQPPTLTNAPPITTTVTKLPVIQPIPTAVTPVNSSAPQVQPPIAAVPPTPTTPTVTNSGLPPLPQKEPRATMVVGVADETVPAATTGKRFSPTDPILP